MRITGGGRQRTGRMAAVACAGLLLISAAGCAAPPPPVPTSATPTPAPVFASDEEALAAATEAYANYLRVHDSFRSDQNVAPDELLSLSTGSVHELDLKSIDDWKEKGWRGTGVTTFDSIRLQGTPIVDGRQQVVTYLCLDVSQGDVVDAGGVSVADADRLLRIPLEVQFEATTTAPTELKVARSDVWQGENFC